MEKLNMRAIGTLSVIIVIAVDVILNYVIINRISNLDGAELWAMTIFSSVLITPILLCVPIGIVSGIYSLIKWINEDTSEEI
jgi:hypothetical protein